MSAQLLVQTLTGFADALAGLRAVLTPAANQLFVYYICPLTNLRGIAANGILPNVAAPERRADLSGQSVQVKRNIPAVLLGGKEVNVHECINLFWNPLNLTMRAFQRNGLLREASSKILDDAVVCVLEINLERLVFDARCRWTIAPQNFAGTGFATFSREQFTGAAMWDHGTPKCDWRSILSVPSHADRALDRKKQVQLNSKRSAELIVHLGDNPAGTSSVALPFDMVDRIIVPANEVRALTDEQNAFLNSTGKIITRLSSVNGVPVYFPKDELLKAERGFLKSLANRSKSDSNVLAKLNAALKLVEQFETDHPELCPSREKFLRPDLADDHHGSMHAARVMFWSAFLAQHLDEATKQELLPVVLVAASMHDTYREKDDETHGQLASEAHQARIAGVLAEPRLRSCLNAIQYHCIPDAQCSHPDLALHILKDADALDRGRFGAPNKQGGCDTKFFRTDVLRLHDAYGNIAWMAYWAAQSTRYSPLGSRPGAEFSRSLCDAVNSLSGKRSG
jgi:hypothetical protein